MGDIQTNFDHFTEYANAWRIRTAQLMEERNLSKSKLGEIYYEREQKKNNPEAKIDKGSQEYKTGKASCERRINRYLKAGIGNQRFPKFEHMIELADFFDVQIGYLIGETDCRTYGAQEVCDYTGLSEEAVKAIKLATAFETAFGATQMWHGDSRRILSKLLSSPFFFGLVKSLGELDCVYTSQSPWKRGWEQLEKRYDAEMLAKVIELHDEFITTDSYPDNDPKGLEITEHYENLLANAGIDASNREEFFNAKRDVEELMDKARGNDALKDDLIAAKRYEAVKKFSQLVNDLYPE